ncbi:helix-turn-helix transcriptional regulator, partial [Ruminococcus sp.]
WIRQSIYRWPGRDYSIDDMAKELSLSRSRFQHIYTETFGVSVNKDVITSRLSKAAELLRTTDLSVKDVGINVGYSNTSYFVKLFGSSYGLTPLQFRQSEEKR